MTVSLYAFECNCCPKTPPRLTFHLLVEPRDAVSSLTKSLLPALPSFPPSPSPSKRKATSKPPLPSPQSPGSNVWQDNTELFEQFGKQVLSAVLSTALTSIDARVRLDSLQALCRCLLCYASTNDVFICYYIMCCTCSGGAVPVVDVSKTMLVFVSRVF